MDVNARLNVKVAATATGTEDLGSPTVALSIDRILAFTPGTDAITKADILFKDTRTLAASASENLDLSGSLTTSFGASIVAAEIVAIYVEASSANTNNVVIGGAASNTFVGPFGAAAHTIAIKPGAFILLSDQAGWPVTAGTGDILKIANSGAGSSVTYNIVIIGRTVAA